MRSVNLKILQDCQAELFKCEIAGLLHNAGKLTSRFMTNCACNKPAGFEYDFSKIIEPSRLPLTLAVPALATKVGVDLANDLLSNHNWGADSPAARLLLPIGGSAVAVRGARSQIKSSFDNARVGSPNLEKQLRRVANQLASAVKLADVWQSGRPSAYHELDSKDHDAQQQGYLFATELKVNSQKVCLGELILLMWDHYHGFPDGRWREEALEGWVAKKSDLQRYLMTCHGDVSEAEKSIGVTSKQSANSTYPSTVFGYEPTGNPINPSALDDIRDIWFKNVMELTGRYLNAGDLDSRIVERRALLEESEHALRQAFGDTQRAINDVTLWDYASNIATLFKASVAKAIIENEFVETAKLDWRLLSIRYDGLEYLSRAHHISDLLARRDTLDAALDEVKSVIEVEYPMGNEIYRDENGSVLLVPYVQEGGRRIELHELECGEAGPLDKLLLERFSDKAYDKERQPLDGEIKPIIALSDEFLGKRINLTKAKAWNDPPLQADPSRVSQWWEDESKHGEVCTVCGLRPQGYGAPDVRHSETGKKGWKLHLSENHRPGGDAQGCEVCKAQSRQICWVCLERRDDRSAQWAEYARTDFQRTIWTNEVPDNNGRVALVVGRFILDGWLDGTLIPTMQKSASFARIQRCWRTTEEFWRHVEHHIPSWFKSPFRSRLTIKPQTAPPNVGKFHSYELEITGAHLSVVWDVNKGEFITCENLDYFQKVAAINLADELERCSKTNEKIKVYEPSAHLSRREVIGSFIVGSTRVVEGPAVESSLENPQTSSPFIPILAKPALFMALVPADKAMAVVGEIKRKYEDEMGKVRDRLSIHIGIVFAPRGTPVRALLEAGRRMLEMPERWEPWEVENSDPAPQQRVVTFKNNGTTWHIPSVMGDGTTDDQWYPHLMLREPVRGGEDLASANPAPWKHAQDLKPGDKVYTCARRTLTLNFSTQPGGASRSVMTPTGGGGVRRAGRFC